MLHRWKAVNTSQTTSKHSPNTSNPQPNACNSTFKHDQIVKGTKSFSPICRELAVNDTTSFRRISSEEAIATEIGGCGLSDGGGYHKHLNLHSASRKLNLLAVGRIL